MEIQLFSHRPSTSSLPGLPARPTSRHRQFALLIVEGEENATARLRGAFEKSASAWKLIRKENGVAALKHMMEDGVPDLLALGDDSGNMTGLEIVRWVRSAGTDFRIPIILYGIRDDSMHQQYSEAGADLILAKPAGSHELFGALERAMRFVQSEGHGGSAVSDGK